MSAQAAPRTAPALAGERYIGAAASGVTRWLSPQAQGVESAFYQYLLQTGHPVPLHLESIAGHIGYSTKDAAKALFALLRHESLEVSHLPAQPAPQSLHVNRLSKALSALTNDLAELALPGQSLMVSTEDGLCLARIGWSRYEADVMAVRVVRSALAGTDETWPLCIHGRIFYLTCSGALQRSHAALSGLARRLLACTMPMQEVSKAC